MDEGKVTETLNIPEVADWHKKVGDMVEIWD